MSKAIHRWVRGAAAAAAMAVCSVGNQAATAEVAEVIDRIVAVIDHKHIVTLSDVQRERLLLTAIGETAPDDAVIVGRLIDRRLVEDQMAQFPSSILDVPNEDLEAELARLRMPLASALPEVRDYIKARLRQSNYEKRRFRQFVQVSEEEKQKYYRDVFVPQARRAGANPIPGLDDPEIDALIKRNVFEEKVDREVASVLDALRARSDVEIFQ